MVFSSVAFLCQFLVPFLLIYYATPVRYRNATLMAASYVFYGCWRPDFLILLSFSSVSDFLLGRRIASEREAGRRGTLYLSISLTVNLGLLAWFKYANFGVEQLNALFEASGFGPIPWVEIILPVGISFYTFQTMSYTIDVWRGQVSVNRNLIDFLCFVSMFPQLVAGPIVRFRDVASQLVGRRHSWTLFGQGLLLFQIGLIKKLLLADGIKSIADGAFEGVARTTGDAWLGIVAYSFQLYFDFSGYSDMAVGLGLMMAFRLPLNFDRPYRSRSITEFWTRWHITLSTWLRDYLYIPLGGNRGGRLRTYRNLALVMILGGLWHGDDWTFLIWGAWHGSLLAIERAMGTRESLARRRSFWAIPLTYGLVLIGWVFFRADDLSSAMGYLRDLFGLGPSLGSSALEFSRYTTLVFAVAAAIVWGAPTSQELTARSPRWFLLLLPFFSLLALAQLLSQGHVPFLYFRF